MIRKGPAIMYAMDVWHSEKRNKKVITASNKGINVLVCIGVYYCALYPIPILNPQQHTLIILKKMK